MSSFDARAALEAALELVAPEGGWFARACALDLEASRCDRAAEGCVARRWYREAADERSRADGLRREAAACRVVAALIGDPR